MLYQIPQYAMLQGIKVVVSDMQECKVFLDMTVSSSSVIVVDIGGTRSAASDGSL